jgi:competence protein ComEC
VLQSLPLNGNIDALYSYLLDILSNNLIVISCTTRYNIIKGRDFMSKSKNYKSLRTLALTLIIALVLIINQYGTTKEKKTSTTPLPSGIIEVHFIDVGEGDSILIETKDSAMLIDAGDNQKGIEVVNYLQSQNIQKLDYLIGTHLRSDHIGGLDDVLNSFPVNRVLMPEIAYNTASFEELQNTLNKKNITITRPEAGTQYNLGNASFTILAPDNSYEDFTDNNLAIKLNFGNNSFLFAGDTEQQSEMSMMAQGYDLSADVLKIGHPSMETRASQEFLELVAPAYAVICVGSDKDIDQPREELLQGVKERSIKLYRTDMQGTIVFTSNGKNISVDTKDYELTDADLID